MHRRLAAATALCATLLLGACTPDAPQPPPQPSSGPTEPSASSSPTPTSPSPTTSEHADLLEVQELYKAEFADEISVLKAGGSNALPPAILNRTSGVYRKVVLSSFREQKKKHQRMVAGPKLLGVAMGKWTPTKVKFRACVDFTTVETVDKNGHKITTKPGSRVVQTYMVLKRHQQWRINSASGKAVNDFTSAACNGRWYQ
jgi:hypothetical protein